MKKFLLELEYIPCKEYIYGRLNGLGNLISLIATGPQLSEGKFYCIANEALLQEHIYEFQTAVSADVWSENEIKDFVANYLNSGTQDAKNLIVEHWMVDIHTKPLFNERTAYYYPMEYYLSKDVVFYRLKEGNNRSDVDNVCRNVAGAWAGANLMMLIDAGLDDLVPKVNIDHKMEDRIVQNACIFFMPVYDNESHLVWIKTGYDSYIKIIERFLNEGRSMV